MNLQEARKLIKENKGQYFVYAICWPNLIPFWIGSSNRVRRLRHHKHDKTVPEKYRIINHLINKGFGVQYHIYDFFLDEETALDKEAELINQYKPHLFNISIGDLHSAESLKKMSDAKKGKMSGENNPMFGKHHSDEALKKMSDSHKRRKVDAA